MRKSEKGKYVKWYRLAERAMGDLIPHPRKNSEIFKWVSMEDWLLIPTHAERDMGEAKNRPNPNIYFSVEDDGIDLGLVCNTQDSIRKMRNILHTYHTREREELLSRLKRLDGGFITTVYAKAYPYHPRQSPNYKQVFQTQANEIDDEAIKEIFRHVDMVRKRGRRKKLAENKRWTPVLPVIDIAKTRVNKKDEDFVKRMTQLKPLYETCLEIKTQAQINREMRRERIVVRICPKCGIQPDSEQRFCSQCGSHLLLEVVSRQEFENMKNRRRIR